MDELEKKVKVGFKTFALMFLLAPKKKICKGQQGVLFVFFFIKSFSTQLLPCDLEDSAPL